MTIDTTIIDKVTAYGNVQSPNDKYRVVRVPVFGIANAAGSGAGASVTTAVAFPNLPSSYGVQVTPDQDAVPYVANKTSTGFDVVLNPRLAANTLSAGTFDIEIVFEK